VAQAVWGMARSLAPDRWRMTLAVAAAALALSFPGTAGQLGAIGLGAVAGFWLPREAPRVAAGAPSRGEHVGAWVALGVFAVLLVGLPLAARATGALPLAVAASFYRSGALVFGGGHVLLPLLQASVVPPGWVTNDAFLAGYGAAQAVPGPLFTFAAFLGTMIGGAGYAALALVAVFLPGFLLVIGTLPLMRALRGNGAYAAALKGVNAAVVGLVLGALYTPVWTSAILQRSDFVIALAAFLLLAFWRAPPWLVVLLGACAAEIAALV
jgi:chromate transporter